MVPLAKVMQRTFLELTAETLLTGLLQRRVGGQ